MVVTLRPLLSRQRIQRLARTRSQGWDAVKAQPRSGGEPQPRQDPDVPRKLGVPALSDLEILDAEEGVAQEPQDPVGIAVRVMELPIVVGPLLQGAVQQRGSAASGDEPDDHADGLRCGLDAPVVVPALQGVLQLELELGTVGERPEVEPLVPIGLAPCDELLYVRAAQLTPSGRMRLAKRRVALCPERAKRQATHAPMLIGHGRDSRQPRGEVWTPGACPTMTVTDAEPVYDTAVATARNLARW
jgi:hypothetical protein